MIGSTDPLQIAMSPALRQRVWHLLQGLVLLGNGVERKVQFLSQHSRDERLMTQEYLYMYICIIFIFILYTYIMCIDYSIFFGVQHFSVYNAELQVWA